MFRRIGWRVGVEVGKGKRVGSYFGARWLSGGKRERTGQLVESKWDLESSEVEGGVQVVENVPKRKETMAEKKKAGNARASNVEAISEMEGGALKGGGVIWEEDDDGEWDLEDAEMDKLVDEIEDRFRTIFADDIRGLKDAEAMKSGEGGEGDALDRRTATLDAVEGKVKEKGDALVKRRLEAKSMVAKGVGNMPDPALGVLRTRGRIRRAPVSAVAAGALRSGSMSSALDAGKPGGPLMRLRPRSEIEVVSGDNLPAPPPLSNPFVDGALILRPPALHPLTISPTHPETLPEPSSLWSEVRFDSDPKWLQEAVKEVDLQWQTLPPIAGAVLVPEGWESWAGWGETFGMRSFGAVVCPKSDEHIPPRIPIGFYIHAHFGATQNSLLFENTESQTLAEWFMALTMRRFDEPIKSSSPTDSNSPEESNADILDSWSHELVKGVDAFGLEFHLPFDDIGGHPDGFRYHTSVIVHQEEDVVYDITFKAPDVLWPIAWRQHGQLLSDFTFLNWHDASTKKFT